MYLSSDWIQIIRLFFFIFEETVTFKFIFNFLCRAHIQSSGRRAWRCLQHAWLSSEREMSHDDQGPSTGLSKRGRISGCSNSTLLDWGAQSGECWSARPGWEWWLPGHGCPKPLKCSTSPQEALWHSSLHFLNQSWVIRAATGKRTDQTIIPPHPPLYPFDMWQSRKSAAQNSYLFFFIISPNRKEHRGSILWFIFLKRN